MANRKEMWLCYHVQKLVIGIGYNYICYLPFAGTIYNDYASTASYQ